MTQNRYFKWSLLTVIGLMAIMTFAVSISAPSAAATGDYASRKMIGKAQAILVQEGDLAEGAFEVGVLDDSTSSALRTFQSRHNMRRTGVLDDETLALLTSHFESGDADGDYVTDALDNCPDTIRGAEVDSHGCPVDADGDGVANGLDSCPGTPKGADADSKGCTTDADGDRVPDGLDQCADTPRYASVDGNGCPIDSDGDGVSDGLDRCANTPAGSQVDDRGCPEQAQSANMFQQSNKLVLEGVNFETNSAKLTEDSQSTLDHVAFTLKDWSKVRVEIGGHTDSQGDDEHNMELSQARADAVRDFLVSQGVDASRLTTRGYGEAEPIADNKSAKGRAKNRRVELTKLD
ncbi:MAG TPA: OmpA family protein [Candidatus Polarisedimenticolia bacterium]|nr:OmpA family protein [Candidatus Polarisedimenticolia bacterium]